MINKFPGEVMIYSLELRRSLANWGFHSQKLEDVRIKNMEKRGDVQ